MEVNDWSILWENIYEIQEWFPEGAVFIGGIAVYAYLNEDESLSCYAAFSHDADMLLAQTDFVDLRDLEEVIPNRRLSKHQFTKSGFEFDVYVQNQNDLKVPFEEAFAASEDKHGVRVACPEHLLCLKGEAMTDRAGTSKGDKDEDDVFRVFLILANRQVVSDRLVYIKDAEMDALERVVEGRAAIRLSEGNAHTAKLLKDSARQGYQKCVQARHDLTEGRNAPP